MVSAYFKADAIALIAGFSCANEALTPNRSRPRLFRSACNPVRPSPALPSVMASTPTSFASGYRFTEISHQRCCRLSFQWGLRLNGRLMHRWLLSFRLASNWSRWNGQPPILKDAPTLSADSPSDPYRYHLARHRAYGHACWHWHHVGPSGGGIRCDEAALSVSVRHPLFNGMFKSSTQGAPWPSTPPTQKRLV